jgi:UDP-4-amino-4-deoxy-L-arabinose formyltransferase/UDP-glucuronic acid dehydrogenase (UDP-4-keto-hexauronic acid decarboxylating)
MKAIAFAYHNMGIVGLEALRRNGFDVLAVFTHEDDPEEYRWFGSVKSWARERGIRVFTPGNVNEPVWVEEIAKFKPDCLFSFYYRQILSEDILRIPAFGAYNLHGSLLPAYRGRVPVNWAIIKGEKVTGVTLHHMTGKADAGDIVGQRRVEIDFYDTARTLMDKLCRAAGELLDELLPRIKAGTAPRITQDENKATRFKGRKAEDGKIDWTKPANAIYNLVRAVTRPYPGAFTFLPDGKKLYVWWCLPDERYSSDRDEIGILYSEDGAVYVWAGRGRVRLLEIEAEGKILKGKEIGAYFQSMGEKKLS